MAGALLLGLLVYAAAFWGFVALSGGFLGLSWGFLGSSGVSCDFCVLALSLRFPSDFCGLAL